MIRFIPRSFLIWVVVVIIIIIQSKILPCSCSSSSSSSSSCQHHHIHHHHTNRNFEQKTTTFWEFEEESRTWVQVKLPYDLVSCVNDTICTKVGIIEPVNDQKPELDQKKKKRKTDEKKTGGLGLSSWKRISVIKMSEDSIWVTGMSGSIYERFWNGVQWVIAPHELPVQAGYAVSVFLVNHTVLALSEAGILYQMHLNENSQPIWVEFTPVVDSIRTIRIKSGVISHDSERIYFCTENGMLLELSETDPPRWINHGKPPGAVVAAIVDTPAIRPHVIFTISSSGELYEFDRSSKPLWKKHIWGKESGKDTALTPSTSSAVHRRTGHHSDSIFLLTKSGNLVERRLHQRKWKWLIHGSPKDEHLTSITVVGQDETYTNPFSLFLTTASGSVFEYNISKQQLKSVKETWVNHKHPLDTRVAKGVSGLHYQAGRVIFPLDDGRLAELHHSKTGGDAVGPTPPVNNRRRVANKYTWSIIDAPESEGWNAEYCTEDRGPLNCISGVKDDPWLRRRTGSKTEEHYHLIAPGKSKDETYMPLENSDDTNFRLRVMHEGRSFFLVTEVGMIYEYLNVENAWFWLQHEYPTRMKAAVGNYNGSLFLVDENKDLIIRERVGNELAWIKKKGRQIIGGPPWNLSPRKVTLDDSLFFVSKTGGLLQLTVALGKLKWKDCKNPWNTKIEAIIDQEVFRENIVFAVGTDGRLYQYNKVTGIWHGHHQSPHMVLSRQPGTAMRAWSKSLTGSLFMISEDGRLVEYHWTQNNGWGWVEHGTPSPGVTVVGSTGPCVGGNQLFLIGSNGNVYLRELDQETWKWSDCGFPYNVSEKEDVDCDPKVSPTRPISFMENSVIFELRDGRLAELQRTEDLRWVWWRTIGTPTSRCNVVYWMAVTS